jgi:hypothetical protein
LRKIDDLELELSQMYDRNIEEIVHDLLKHLKKTQYDNLTSELLKSHKNSKELFRKAPFAKNEQAQIVFEDFSDYLQQEQKGKLMTIEEFDNNSKKVFKLEELECLNKQQREKWKQKILEKKIIKPKKPVKSIWMYKSIIETCRYKRPTPFPSPIKQRKASISSSAKTPSPHPIFDSVALTQSQVYPMTSSGHHHGQMSPLSKPLTSNLDETHYYPEVESLMNSVVIETMRMELSRQGYCSNDNLMPIVPCLGIRNEHEGVVGDTGRNLCRFNFEEESIQKIRYNGGKLS